MDSKNFNEYRDFIKENCKGIIDNCSGNKVEGFSVENGTFTNLLWPCMLYRVEVKSSKLDLDIFERTVLSLAECKITATKEVAERMKMSPEIIDFIQNRLKVRGYVKDASYEITDEGLDALRSVASGESSETIVVCLLKDLVSGKLLDFAQENPALNSVKGIFQGKDKDTGEGIPNQNFVRYYVPGDAEKKADLVYHSLSEIQANMKKKPESFLLLRAIRRFNKTLSDKDLRIPIDSKSNFVDIKNDGELVLVHTTAFTTTSGQIFSTDAFGSSVSDIYTDFIRHTIEELSPWLSRLHAKIQTGEASEDISEEKIPHFSYYTISKPLFKIAKTISQIMQINAKEGVEEREESKRKGEQVVYDLYTAVEQALLLYYKEYRNPNSEDTVIIEADREVRQFDKEKIGESGEENKTTVFYYPLAEKLGFELTGAEKFALKVYQGRINAVRKDEGNADFISLLCLVLANANLDEECPFDYLCEKHPGFISRMLALKALRDKTYISHGPGLSANEITKDKLENTWNDVASYLCLLSPKLAEDVKQIKEACDGLKNTRVESSPFFMQKRYNIKMELYEKFGNATVNSLSNNLKNQMVNCELSFSEKRYIVSSICSVLQQFFEAAILSLIKRTNPPEKEQRKAEAAQEKCSRCGFSLQSGRLPDALKTVNYRKIGKAVCGGGADSLGAAVIAFVLLASEQELESIAGSTPNFLVWLGELLAERGHADVREYSAEEVSTYQKKYTSIIKEIIPYIE